ncbi:hypothetical protein YC2023_108816 [Brassica napus]
MVFQIVWLGVRDVFTQIAKDVVGQGLYHDTLTFKVIRSPRGLLYKTFFFIRPVMLTLESFFVRLGLIVRRIFRVSNGDRFYEGCKSPNLRGLKRFIVSLYFRKRNRELVSSHFLRRKVAARFSIFSRTVAFA